MMDDDVDVGNPKTINTNDYDVDFGFLSNEEMVYRPWYLREEKRKKGFPKCSTRNQWSYPAPRCHGLELFWLR